VARRPRVLHVVRDWVRPSEGFVADLVGGSARTQPFVAFGVRGGSPTPEVPTHYLGGLAARGDRPLRLALAGLAVARRVEVLHAHFGYWAGHCETAARRTGRPWALSLHGHDLLVEGCPTAVLADLVIVPSGFLADAASRAGVRDERLRVIPSGLDLGRLPYRERSGHPGPVVVTFAGRFVEKKGVLDAARAMASVPGLRCRFVGTGPLEADLCELLRELGLSADVLDGSVPGAVVQALQETDLLLTASRIAVDGDAETLGLVNLEAQACGVPVVTTDSGGVRSAVSPEGAVLVPEGDVLALRAALGELARHPQRWAAMGRAGRQHVEAHFVLADRVAELEEHWVQLAARRLRR
jgi:colanic acid/amylovoran biosynthesis glycosyltransferase